MAWYLKEAASGSWIPINPVSRSRNLLHFSGGSSRIWKYAFNTPWDPPPTPRVAGWAKRAGHWFISNPSGLALSALGLASYQDITREAHGKYSLTAPWFGPDQPVTVANFEADADGAGIGVTLAKLPKYLGAGVWHIEVLTYGDNSLTITDLDDRVDAVATILGVTASRLSGASTAYSNP